MVTEDAIPPEPTRQEELAYLDSLEKSLLKDPWITLHPKKYMASPYRLAYVNYREMQLEYRKTFLKNFALSVLLSWPLTIL